jgi:hypothetical protein
MPIDPKFKPYKHTGNISVDLVAGCINFYHCQDIKLKAIRLNKMHWTMFKGFVMEQLPGLFTVYDNEIDFDGVMVAPSAILSNEPMTWEFVKAPEKKIFYMTDYRKN